MERRHFPDLSKYDDYSTSGAVRSTIYFVRSNEFSEYTCGYRILPGMFTVLGTFLMRQFFMTLPNELLEASKVDGAGYWRMFWQLSLPLTKPAIVTLLILTFTWHWNEYENPLILLRSRNLFTIPIGLSSFSDETGTDYPLIMAASVSALGPLIVIVAICQRWFVEGIANTGLKG